MENDNSRVVTRLRYDLTRFATDRWDITVAVNHACNLRCIYCYEQKCSVFMTENTGRKLLKFIAANGAKSRSLCVTWYGGEPLLSADLVLRLSTFAKETLSELGCKYEAGIVTNATLLNPDLAVSLLRAGISHGQVTLDGNRRDHDRRRTGLNGQPTYDTVLNALAMFPANMTVAIRVNVDAENVERIPQMLEDLCTVDTSCQSVVYFAPLDTCGEGCGRYRELYGDKLLTPTEVLDHVAEILPLACRLGLSVKLPLRDAYLCGAVSRQSLVVEPDGSLKKCWNDVGASGGVVGTLDEPLRLDNSGLVSWLTHDPFRLEECQGCEVFEACVGGCPWMVRQGVLIPQRCHALKGGVERIRQVVDDLESEGLARFDNEHGIVVGLGNGNSVPCLKAVPVSS